MINLPPGCPFWPRCRFRSEICTETRPRLTAVSGRQSSACWHIDKVNSARDSAIAREFGAREGLV